jgi:hypothetical protein
MHNLSPGSSGHIQNDGSVESPTNRRLIEGPFSTHSLPQTSPGQDPLSNYNYNSNGAAVEELPILRSPLSQSSHTINIMEIFSPLMTARTGTRIDIVAEQDYGVVSTDGIFLPGSTYLDLHTTLRNHIIESAKSNSRVWHDIAASEWEIPVEKDCRPRPVQDNDRFVQTSSPPSLSLTPSEEYVLWKKYINEIGPWVCKIQALSRQKLANKS